jgi:hypothetical protein
MQQQQKIAMKTFRYTALFLWSALTLASPVMLHAQMYPNGYELLCNGGDQPISPGTFDPATQMLRAYLCFNPGNGHVSSPVFATGTGITSLSAGSGITLTPNPITATGTVALNTALPNPTTATTQTTGDTSTDVANDAFVINNINAIPAVNFGNLPGGTNTTAAMLVSGTSTLAPSGTGHITADICNNATSQCTVTNITQGGAATSITLTPGSGSPGNFNLKSTGNFTVTDASGDFLNLVNNGTELSDIGGDNILLGSSTLTLADVGGDTITMSAGVVTIAPTTSISINAPLTVSAGCNGCTPTSPTFTTAKITTIETSTGHMLISSTAPTVASGFGTSPSIPHANGTAAFTVNVGTGGTASSGVLTLPAATTGWTCHVDPNAAPQAAGVTYSAPTSTTSVTLTNYTQSTGVALAWAASEVLQVSCFAY